MAPPHGGAFAFANQTDACDHEDAMVGYPYEERQGSMRNFVKSGEFMKMIRTASIAVFAASVLAACSANIPIPADASQPNMQAYSVLDRFDGPDGKITLFCRNGDLFVDKNGDRAGSIQFFFKHEMCQGR